MAEAGTFAYPVLIAVMIAVVYVGRGERWGAFEWMRLGALGILMGLVVAVQVSFAMLGFVQSPLTIAAGLVSLAGAATVVGAYLWHTWLARAPAPPATA